MRHKKAQIEDKSKCKTNDHDGRIEDVISALDFLRSEAKKSGNEDIYKLIDSTFTICLHTFCIIKRYELNSIFKGVDVSGKLQ